MSYSTIHLRQFIYKVSLLILINKTKVRIMNKLKTLVASLVVATLSFGAANSIEIRAGLTGQSTGYYANVEETLKDAGRKTQTDGVAAFSYMSVFGEVAFDSAMGISLGLEFTPDTITIDDNASRIINGSINDGSIGGAINETSEGEGGGDAAGGIQKVGASIKDLTLIYVGVPLMETGLTVKVGVQTATLQTTETLATGSTYKDVDMEGASVGLYYDGAITDNLFYRLEGAYTYFDDMSTTGSEVGGTAGTFNKITAELTGVAAKASIGFKF